MARYIDADLLIKEGWHLTRTGVSNRLLTTMSIADVPTADVVEVETIKSWLYEIAINNVGCVVDGDFSAACEEIISRLDGLRNFAREWSDA